MTERAEALGRLFHDTCQRRARPGQAEQLSWEDRRDRDVVVGAIEEILSRMESLGIQLPSPPAKERPHLIDGEFQSDKYPSCPRGKVPLSTKDPMAQDLLWEYAERRRSVDAAFGEDLREALRLKGYEPPSDPECDLSPLDSAELIALRSQVDQSLGWDSPEAKEKADYVNRIWQFAYDMRSTIEKLRASLEWRRVMPVDLILVCPSCQKQHLDVGEFETRVHRTHKCEHTPTGKDGCGAEWTPFWYATRGRLHLHPVLGQMTREELVATLVRSHGYETARSDGYDILVREAR